MSNTRMISKVVGAFEVIYIVEDKILIISLSPTMPSTGFCSKIMYLTLE